MILTSRNHWTNPERYVDVIYEINAKENLSLIGGNIDSDIPTINSGTKCFNSK
jgi:CMP-2-keto-3-deoxyoctulosonic acid synthetase